MSQPAEASGRGRDSGRGEAGPCCFACADWQTMLKAQCPAAVAPARCLSPASLPLSPRIRGSLIGAWLCGGPGGWGGAGATVVFVGVHMWVGVIPMQVRERAGVGFLPFLWGAEAGPPTCQWSRRGNSSLSRAPVPAESRKWQRGSGEWRPAEGIFSGLGSGPCGSLLSLPQSIFRQAQVLMPAFLLGLSFPPTAGEDSFIQKNDGWGHSGSLPWHKVV